MMATLDLEDRKRPLDIDTLDNPSTATKRPHLDRSSSSFHSSGPLSIKQERQEGLDEDEDSIPAYKGLEAFRKEAIYRQMREAKRDLQRSEGRVRQLQGAIQSMDDRCAALNQFWDTLVEDVRLLVREDELANKGSSALFEAIPLTSSTPVLAVFTESLQERNASMKAILTRIVSLGSESRPEVDQLQGRCHRLGEEAASLRSQLALAITDKQTLSEELSSTIDQLRKAEKRVDRLHSATIKATERPGAQAEEEAEQAKVDAANAEKQAAIQRKERAEGEVEGENGMQARGNRANGMVANEELEDYKRLAQTRLEECDRWRNQIMSIRQENERLKQDMQETLDSRLVESPLYKELHMHFNEIKQQLDRITSVNERIEAENGELRERRIEFETKAKAEADAQVDQLRSTIKAHEADVARLRSQRDEINDEVMERKQRETVRFAQIDEMKALVQSKESRMVALKSEVRRLQLTVAAKSGNVGLSEQLQRAQEGEEGKREEEDVKMIEVLQGRLKAAEESSQDLKRQLDARSSSTSEQDLVAKVAALQSELDQLCSVVKQAGSEAGVLPDDVKARLVGQNEEIKSLKRDLALATESTSALCDELDKIGEAYNQSQKVATERVVEAGKMEDRMSRLTAEKAKADQKYFAAMRAKEAIEVEKRATMRNADWQAKVIENFKETEKTFQAQLQQGEQELSHLRDVVNQQNKEVLRLKRDGTRVQNLLQDAMQAKAEAEAASLKHSAEWVEESRARQDKEERCEKLQRELDRCKKQLAASGGSSKKKGLGGDDVQIEYLNSLLRCSACKDRYRDRIITRCLHTFCQDCVDARIQTRQRKCPHCGLGFSTSDVQTLYLQ